MIAEPWFWRENTRAAAFVGAALTPAAKLYDFMRRLGEELTPVSRAPVPVICIGAATLGGVGKTPFALLCARLLQEEGINLHFLTRGYGGALKGPVRVDPETQTAQDVGDEALLLAAAAPTWVARMRPHGALAAANAGADVIVMDDGYQNPSLEKTLSFLLIDNEDPFGNGRVFPAGPLREPVASARARANAIVHIGRKQPGDETLCMPTFNAWLEPEASPTPARAFAFCGIGRPERFFGLLESLGFDLAGRVAFPDHHPYDAATLTRLRAQAKTAGAPLITTAKDKARLGAEGEDIATFDVVMRCDDEAGLKALLLRAARGERTADA